MTNQPQYMAHDPGLPELTLRGMLLGMVLTVIFTASNVYLGLRVGMTFSSAIPAAVISMAVLKIFPGSNILENNMVQTQASAAGTLSAIIFIIPGLLMIGYWQGFQFWQTLLVSACGGCLGVLFTIPLRRAMVVHSSLPYPEGLAAAEILKVGAGSTQKEGGLKEILLGTAIAGIIAMCANGFKFLSTQINFWFSIGKHGETQLPLGFSAALLGAGYLIGIASGLAMLTGVILAWFGFVPYFTSTTPLPSGMSVHDFSSFVWADKVRLIGAGAMGVAAIWTLIALARPVWNGMKESIASALKSEEQKSLHRMDTDMHPFWISVVFILMFIGLLGVFYSFVVPAGLPTLPTLLFVVVSVLVAVLVGFFVAAACAYMAGLVGTSSSPISGIGILGVIISSLVVLGLAQAFSVFEMDGGEKFATAMAIFTTSIIVAIACISNDNMQDLKTGSLVGATPWRQQVALIIGCLVGALVIAPVLNLLYEAYGFAGALPREGMDPSQVLSAPQATLMTTIAKGIFSSQLQWDYIFIGVALGVVLVIVDVILRRSSGNKLALPPLAVGMGLYLPPEAQTPLIVGAVFSWVVDRFLKKKARKTGEKEEDVLAKGRRKGTLFASGLIVGESIIGVVLAALIVVSVSRGGSDSPLALVGPDFSASAEYIGLGVFILLLVLFAQRILADRK